MDDEKHAAASVRQPHLRSAQHQRDIIVIGGSAGALDTMLQIAGAFPGQFQGSIFIVSHIGANRSHLPALLSNAGPLPAAHAEDGEPIRPGRVYVAPPDRHMTIEDGRLRLSRGPRQHFTRPAVDPLFRSAAAVFGPRVVGVVLSGAGSDGTAGLEAINRAGGATVVQDPGDALYPAMPHSASAALAVDHVVAGAELPALLRRLSSERVTMKASSAGRETPVKADLRAEEFERPVALTCPECGGAMHEVDDTAVKQYRCHTGHQFGATEVADGQAEEVDHALEVAVRVLNERVELCRQMVEDARSGGRSLGVTHWRRLQSEAEEQVRVLLQFLTRTPAHVFDEATGDGPEHAGAANRNRA